jgi:hypothetical protein
VVVKLRLPGRRTAAETSSDPSADLTEQLVKAGGKGRPTPKRIEAQGRRPGPLPPPPTSRKEAYRRMRDTRATSPRGARAAVSDADRLMPRDRGAVRALVRDVVDSRRNAASIFLLVAVLVLGGNLIPDPTLRGYVPYLWSGFFVLIAADSFLLARRIRTAIAERFPGEAPGKKGAVWYGISRSTMIRRWRFPKPGPSPTAGG